ncbi:MAG: hypothetical protein LBR11_06110 [Deltaproteobacteria bacterium]|nr:hypothetical protein [Deltaproteobacteria bacterium]
MANLAHPNICLTLDTFSLNSTVYRVFLNSGGQTLERFLKTLPPKGKIGDNQILAWLGPLVNALRAGHEKNILHGHLSPTTIVLASESHPVLLGFGDSCLPQAPGYRAPELLEKNPANLGPWTDLYSLGAVILRCLTGREPVDSRQRRDAVVLGDQDPLEEDLRSLNDLSHGELAQAVRSCLTLNRRERAQSCGAFLKLARAGSCSSVRGPKVAEPVPTSPSLRPESPALAQPPVSPARALAAASGVSNKVTPLVDGIWVKIRAWLIPISDRPAGPNDDQLRELRAVALRERNKTTPKDYALADKLAKIDEGERASFRLPAFLISFAWTAYELMLKRALILYAVFYILIFSILLINIQVNIIFRSIFLFCFSMICGFFGLYWLKENVDQRIDVAWRQSEGNFDQARHILSKQLPNKRNSFFKFNLIVAPFIYLILFISANSPYCDLKQFQNDAINLFISHYSKNLNISQNDFKNKFNFQILDVEAKEEKFKKCVCNLSFDFVNLDNNKSYSGNLKYTVYTDNYLFKRNDRISIELR